MLTSSLRLALLGGALILGVLWDRWFGSPWLGVAVPLWVALLLVGLGGLAAGAQRAPVARNLWCVAAALLFAAIPAVRDAPFLVLMNVAAALALLMLVAQFFTQGAIDALQPLDYAEAMWSVALGALARPAEPVGATLNAATARLPARATAVPIVRGLLIATPFLLVFTALLASADVVFGAYVERVLRIDFGINPLEFLGHSFVSLVVAWLVAGGLLHALRAAPGAAPAAVAAPPAGEQAAATAPPVAATQSASLRAVPAAQPSLGFLEAVVVLGAVDLLFAAFVGVQFAYLFGGRETLDVAGLTYAEYARRGFFELLAVGAIALPLVAGLDWLARRETVRQRRLFQALAGVAVLLTAVILVSAMERMLLYEDAYGYTELRVYSHAFMLWLAALCLLFLATLVAERRQMLAFGTLLLLVAGLGGLDLVNPDRFIAEQNLDRYARGRPLDATHLSELSADATPTVLRALDLAASRDDAPVRDALGSALRGRLRSLDLAAEAPWPTYNLARATAHATLAARRAELDAYPPRGRRVGD